MLLSISTTKHIPQSAILNFTRNHFLLIPSSQHKHFIYSGKWIDLLGRISSVEFKDLLRKDTFWLEFMVSTCNNCMAHSILSLYFKESGTPSWKSRIQGNDGALHVVRQKSCILTHYKRRVQCRNCQGIKTEERHPGNWQRHNANGAWLQ